MWGMDGGRARVTLNCKVYRVDLGRDGKSQTAYCTDFSINHTSDNTIEAPGRLRWVGALLKGTLES